MNNNPPHQFFRGVVQDKITYRNPYNNDNNMDISISPIYRQNASKKQDLNITRLIKQYQANEEQNNQIHGTPFQLDLYYQFITKSPATIRVKFGCAAADIIKAILARIKQLLRAKKQNSVELITLHWTYKKHDGTYSMYRNIAINNQVFMHDDFLSLKATAFHLVGIYYPHNVSVIVNYDINEENIYKQKQRQIELEKLQQHKQEQTLLLQIEQEKSKVFRMQQQNARQHQQQQQQQHFNGISPEQDILAQSHFNDINAENEEIQELELNGSANRRLTAEEKRKQDINNKVISKNVGEINITYNGTDDTLLCDVYDQVLLWKERYDMTWDTTVKVISAQVIKGTALRIFNHYARKIHEKVQRLEALRQRQLFPTLNEIKNAFGIKFDFEFESFFNSIDSKKEILKKYHFQLIIDLLSKNFDKKDNYPKAINTLKSIKQRSQDVIVYMNKFDLVYATVERIRKWMNERQQITIYREMDTYEKAEIFKAGLNVKASEWLISEAIKQYGKAYIKYDEVMILMEQYEKISAASLAAAHSRRDVQKIYAFDSMQQQFNDLNLNETQINYGYHDINSFDAYSTRGRYGNRGRRQFHTNRGRAAFGGYHGFRGRGRQNYRNNNGFNNRIGFCNNGTLEMCKKVQTKCTRRHRTSEEYDAFSKKCKQTTCIFLKSNGKCTKDNCLYDHTTDLLEECKYEKNCDDSRCNKYHPQGRKYRGRINMKNYHNKGRKNQFNNNITKEIGHHHRASSSFINSFDVLNNEQQRDYYYDGYSQSHSTFDEDKIYGLNSFELEEEIEAGPNKIDPFSLVKKYNLNQMEKEIKLNEKEIMDLQETANESKSNINDANINKVKLIENNENYKYMELLPGGLADGINDKISQIMTEQINRKKTIDYYICGTDKVLSAFIDSGAGISIIGKNIAANFQKYKKDTKQVMRAMAMDNHSTKKIYNLSSCYEIPLVLDYFNYDKGITQPIRRNVEFWLFQGAKPNEVILGRDGMRTMEVYVMQGNHLKKCIYHVTKGKSPSELPKNEALDNMMKRLDYRTANEPGIRRLDSKIDEIFTIPDDYVRKIYTLEIENERNAQNEMLNDINIRKNDKAMKIYKFKQNADEKAVNVKMKDDTLEKDKIKSAAKLIIKNELTDKNIMDLLNKIKFGKEVTQEEQDLFKRTMIKEKLLSVISTHSWDVGKVEGIPPFKVKVKDENKCRIKNKYDLNNADTKVLFEEFDYFIQQGIGHWAKQDEIVKHASPGFIAHRKIGVLPDSTVLVKSRLVIDYVELNKNTHKMESYETVKLVDLLDHVGRLKYKNKFDISKYFYSIVLDEDAKKYTAVIAPNGRIFIFDRMPTGLKNAPIYGQMITTNKFKNTDIITVQDDCFGGGSTKLIALKNGLNALRICKEAGFKVRPNDIEIAMDTITACGYVINQNGHFPAPRNCTKALCADPKRMKNYHDLQIYIGMLNFIGNYLYNIAEEKQKLVSLLMKAEELEKIKNSKADPAVKRRTKEQLKLNWSQPALQLINRINKMVECLPLLHHIDTTADAKPLLLKSDASATGICATLWQLRRTQYVLCRIYSKLLTATQRNYSATEREATGLVSAMDWFSKYLKFKCFIMIGDHLPLRELFNVGKDTKNKKLLRIRAFIQEFEFIFIYHEGTSPSLVLEDFGSRISLCNKQNKSEKNGVVAPLFNKEAVELVEEINENNQQRKKNLAINQLELKENNIMKQIREEYQIKVIEVEYLHESDIALLTETNVTSINKLNAFKKKWPGIDMYESKGILSEKYVLEEPLANKFNFKNEQKRINDEYHYNMHLNSIKNGISLQENCNAIISENINKMDLFQLNDVEANVEILQLLKLSNDAMKIRNYAKFGIRTMYQLDLKYKDALNKMHILAINECKEMPIYKIHAQTVAGVETRAMKKKRLELEADSDLPALISYRGYVADPHENLKFTTINKSNDNISNLEHLHHQQHEIYRNLIRYLTTKKKIYLQPKYKTFQCMDYYKLIEQNKLYLNDENVLCYKSNENDSNRIIVPDSCRIELMTYYHLHPACGYHSSATRMIGNFKQRFYWIGMEQDIKEFVGACYCAAGKMINRKKVGFKDKGISTNYHCTRVNQYVFIDLWGPTSNGNFIVVMVDGFNNYTVVKPLKPLYDPTAVGIIMFIIYEWVYKLGICEHLISDNGSNLVNKINSLWSWTFGVKRNKICTYSPWANGKAENKMKAINKFTLIENVRRELVKVRAIKNGLIEGKAFELKNIELFQLCCAIELEQNNKIDATTGFKPIELRSTGSHIMMDVNLGLAVTATIKDEDYLQLGIPDYKKYKKLLSTAHKMHMVQAKRNKIKYLQKKNELNDENSATAQKDFKLNDHVMFKTSFKSKKKPNATVGWIITDINHKHNKRTYEIKNVITKQKQWVNAGHITRLFTPKSIERLGVEQNETTKLFDLANKGILKEVESNKKDKEFA